MASVSNLPALWPFPTSQQTEDQVDNSLSVVDNRTGLSYNIPIKQNSIHATDFHHIKSPHNAKNRVEQNNAGIRIFDPGFQNTACMESEITYVDGDAGEIAYRGIPVADLFRSGRPFEHVAFLLIFGHLPSDSEAEAFNTSIATSEMPPQAIFDTINNLPLDTHAPTAIGATLALHASLRPEKIPAYRGENLYKGNMAAIDKEVPQQIFTVSVISTAIFCRLHGREFTPPKPTYSYIENMLHMMGFVEKETGRPDPRVVKLLNSTMILMADHEITNSASVVLSTASTLADPYSCCAAATLAGIGILHGGAIEVAYKQLEAVRDLKEVPMLIEAVKAGKMRLSGYGHRKWKLPDPRSVLFRELITEAMKDMQSLREDHHLAVALEIDRVASQDPYFQSRHLCANADLFLSFAYKAMGIPVDFILPMTLLNRNPGYVAHWREAMADPKPRMWRPLQIYVGNIPKEQGDDLKQNPVALSSL
ncbi:hypothetical protein INS49_014703 [Diaporthe citri]|uniref:uncharacterized protein n=1 Tax=Diaporthe citri TaxID=83186 RepID=UPI001C7FDDEB|nr:uncharacterized protein INS49_014703 [Diaporthe citri]KAG6356829.1 hypothetical protein INS49_014703 [Diaporthe citri]